MYDPKLDEIIHKYDTFINDVLREDLRILDIRLQQINAEITDLVQQKHTLKLITNKEEHPDGFKTQVNLGCNFFMEAAVRDTSTMLVHIGLNNYLEFTIVEATKYLDVRLKAFEDKSIELRNKSAETKAHIKLLLLGIGQLQSSDKYKAV